MTIAILPMIANGLSNMIQFLANKIKQAAMAIVHKQRLPGDFEIRIPKFTLPETVPFSIRCDDDIVTRIKPVHILLNSVSQVLLWNHHPEINHMFNSLTLDMDHP